ncbi:MAG: hypothetical protein M5U26_11560 [Planctomycetota bacterium]|nr:hypothetical protein [Planctomycetota bacterium]
MKRKYQLSQTWGSIYTVNFNGKIISVRLNVEDTIAHRMVHGMGDPRNDFELIDVESTNGEPTGIPEVHKRLVALKRGYNVEVDTAYETVAVTAPAWTIADLMDCALYDLKAQDLAPEEAARKAKNFRAAHLAEITGNALKSMTDADKKSLGKAVIELDDGNFDVREGAEKRLLAAGANALLLLNKVDLEKVSAEKRQRIQRLIPLIKNEIETRPVLMAAEAYLAAGMAGNLDAIKKDMWTSGRVKEFQNAEAAYARELAAAKRKPDVLRELQKDAESTFQASLIKLMKVKDARVEKIIVSGSRAEVTYSVEVDAKHPLFEFCQNLKVVRGVMRAQSRFCMENINKKWLAAENRQITDAQPTTWLRSGGDEETTTVGSSISEVQTDENNIEVRVSGSTHAISFGY